MLNSVIDAAGKRVRLSRKDSRIHWWWWRDGTRREVLTVLAWTLGPNLAGGLCGFALNRLALAWLETRAPTASLGWYPVLSFVAPMLFAFGGIITSALGGCRAMNAFTVRRRLRESRCPACLYDLAGLSRSDTALVLCPECGATWQLKDSPNNR